MALIFSAQPLCTVPSAKCIGTVPHLGLKTGFIGFTQEPASRLASQSADHQILTLRMICMETLQTDGSAGQAPVSAMAAGQAPVSAMAVGQAPVSAMYA